MTRVYAALAILAALALVGWRVHHAIDAAGYDRGVTEGARQAAAERAERDAARAESAQCAAALGIADAQAKTEQHRAEEAQRAGERLAAAAQEESRRADESLREWQRRYAAAARTPECADILEMQLCAAVSDY